MEKLESLIKDSLLLPEEKDELLKIVSSQSQDLIEELESLVVSSPDLGLAVVEIMKIKFIEKDHQKEQEYLEKMNEKKKKELGINT